jgi:iron(III) transport system permease protein
LIDGSPWPAVGLWAMLVAVVAGIPLGKAMFDAIEGLAGGDGSDLIAPNWSLLGLSVVWAALIGCLSVVVGWVGAWASRGWRAWWTPVLVVPILMPSSLASSGFGLLRAPGTAIGDWLAMGPSWRPIFVGKAIAVIGLALWTSPIAQLVISARVRSIDPASLEAARLVGGGPTAWMKLRVGMSLRHILLAMGAVSVFMLGSAVPLHLAQMETYATQVWLELDATAANDRWRVLVSAWPVLVVACCASLFVVWHFRRCPGWLRGQGGEESSVRFVPIGIALAVPLFAVGVPATLFALDLESLSTVSTVWRTESVSAGLALLVAAALAVSSVLIAASVWIGLGGGLAARRVTLAGVALMLMLALLPGVVTGVLVGSAWRSVGVVSDSWVIVLLAHLARFGAMPAMVGVLLAWSEAEEDRDLRRMTGAMGVIGWAKTVGVRSWPAIALAGVASAALSIHEIESAVVVSPPGMASLARSMLNLLHFQRYEHLAGLSLIVIALGTLPVAVSCALWWLWIRTSTQGGANRNLDKGVRSKDGGRRSD